jgi:hypothetical protein
VDVLNRIKYDAVSGAWKVIHGGKELPTPFKTSGDAFSHLEGLLKAPKK